MNTRQDQIYSGGKCLCKMSHADNYTESLQILSQAGHVDKDFMVHSRAPHKLRNLYLNGREGCLNQKSCVFSYFPMLKYICHYFSCSFTAALVMISCWGGCSSGGWSGSPSNGKVTGQNPWLPWLHVQASLSKILNPNVLLMTFFLCL